MTGSIYPFSGGARSAQKGRKIGMVFITASNVASGHAGEIIKNTNQVTAAAISIVKNEHMAQLFSLISKFL